MFTKRLDGEQQNKVSKVSCEPEIAHYKGDNRNLYGLKEIKYISLSWVLVKLVDFFLRGCSRTNDCDSKLIGYVSKLSDS